MDSSERFGQLEMLMAEMLRRLDRQGEQMDRQSRQMDRQSEQIDDIINILKISDARQTRAEERQDRAEERQDAMLAEIRRQGQQLDSHAAHFGQLLQAQMQLLNMVTRNAERTDNLEQRFPVVLGYEDRMKRLEEAVFKKAS